MNYQHESEFLKTKYIEYLFPGLSLVDFFSLIVFVSVIVLHVVRCLWVDRIMGAFLGWLFVPLVEFLVAC